MLINEIFTSIDGEARRAGELATFIRSFGCLCACTFCDSTYSWAEKNNYKVMSVDEILKECDNYGVHNITFTGGEPLIQKDADELITTFAKAGYDVSIETSGAVDFTEKEWFKRPDMYPNVWVCADFKCPFSGAMDKMISIEKFAKLRENDVLKFVVAHSDLPTVLEVIKQVRELGCNCYIYISPVFGEIDPKEIVEFMQANDLQNKIRVQLQIHKYIWDPNMRGV